MNFKSILITALAALGPLLTIAAPASNDVASVTKRDTIDVPQKRDGIIGGDACQILDTTVDGVLSTGAEDVDIVTGEPPEGVDRRDTSEEPFAKRQNQENKNLQDAFATFVVALKVFAEALATIQATLLKVQQQNGSITNPIYAASVLLQGTVGTLQVSVTQGLNLAGQIVSLLGGNA